jgi:1-acyl-sn-glycerol-3-phosphate acyltransferase
MRKVYLYARCVVFWILSIIHFFPVCTALVILGIFVDPRKNDWPQRFFFRNILRFAGVGFRVVPAAGFDPNRTSIFLCNHVNLFDAFIIYSAIPQFVRGWELETHFKVPAYGWMMERFGNIPVPEATTPAAYKELIRRTKAALDDGVSLIVFPEGGRTHDGGVGEFQKGIFRLLPQLGYPIVPMSIVGAYEFNRKASWVLYPSTITVHLHDTIETKELSRQDVEPLATRVHAIISRPVDEHREKKARPGRQDPTAESD